MKLIVLSLFLLFIDTRAFCADKMGFWKNSPRGANMDSTNPKTDYCDAYAKGIRLVRIGATGSPGDLRWFVAGIKPDDVWDLSRESIAQLRSAVQKAADCNLKVVITLAHFPGRNWEHRKRDYRIWKNSTYQEQLALAWRTIASEFSQDAAVVGFDLINEPYFEKETSAETQTKSL